jgi:hypothetical protein
MERRLKEIREAADPKGWRVGKLRTEIKRIAEKDNVEKLLGYGGSAWAGVDRYGRDLVTPADSTIKRWRLRLGRVLAPEGLNSRAITRFHVDWHLDGTTWHMLMGWLGISWMIYHLKGAPKGSKASQPNWSLPQRDIGGISPKGWVEVREAFSRFWTNVRRRAT